MKATTRHLVLPAAIALLTLAACSDKDQDGNSTEPRTAIRITTAIITGNNHGSNPAAPAPAPTAAPTAAPAPAQTRATDAAWQPDDAIGILLLNAGTNTPAEGKTAYRYLTANTTGAFAPADADNTAYYPTQGEKVDIIAFYPYCQPDEALNIPVSTAQQSALSQIDLMVAERSTGHSVNNPDVSLAFRHKLVKLIVNVSREATAADLDLNGATILLQGTATDARWSLTEQQLITDPDSRADISLPATYDATEAAADATGTDDDLPGLLTATAIVLPTAADASLKLVITTADGKSLDAPLAAGTALLEGTVNTLRVHLRQTAATVNATVSDWTTGITAQLRSLTMDVTATDGTAASVHSLTLWNAATPDAKALYTYSDDDDAWTSPTPFYLENLLPDATFYARHTPTAPDGTPLTDPVSLLPDLLGNVTPAPLQGGGIDIALKHLYTRLDIALLKGADFPASTSLAGATLTLNGFNKKADVSDKNLVTSQDPGSYTLTTDDAGNASLIVLPQTVPAATTFTLRLKNTGTAATNYTATLTEALELKSGQIATLKLTLTPSRMGISVSPAPWTTGDETPQSIHVDDLADGSGKDNIALNAAQGDLLRLTYLTDDDDALAATYLYTDDAWTCTAPLYWDQVPQSATRPLRFAALFTPAAAPVGQNETDYLAGTATTPFGTAPAFVLTHALARIELQLTAPEFTPAELAAATVELHAVLPLAAIDADGTTTTDPNAQPRTLNADQPGQSFSLILAPQSFSPGSRLATITLANHTYGISTPDGMKAEAGKTTLLKIGISKSELNSITVGTTPWTPGETHEGDAGYDD